MAQAPVGGIGPRVGDRPGSAMCKPMIKQEDELGYKLLYTGGDDILVLNWGFDLVADLGDRVIQVEGHFNGALLVGYQCNVTADPDIFETAAAAEEE